MEKNQTIYQHTCSTNCLLKSGDYLPRIHFHHTKHDNELVGLFPTKEIKQVDMLIKHHNQEGPFKDQDLNDNHQKLVNNIPVCQHGCIDRNQTL